MASHHLSKLLSNINRFLLPRLSTRCSSTATRCNPMTTRTMATTPPEPPTSVAVGDKASSCKTFTEADVALYGDLTTDLNPMHFDAEFAARTRFKKPIVHGALALGLVSGVMGTKLPGPGTVVTSMDVHFTGPIYMNEQVEAEVEAVSVTGSKAVLTFTCSTTTQDAKVKVALKGQAKVILPNSKLVSKSS